MRLLCTAGQNVKSAYLSILTWYTHRTAAPRYRAQAHVVAAWVAREVRRVIRGDMTPELSWQVDEFQLFLAHAIYRELLKNNGYYPISNSPLKSPAALFEQAVAAARIYPPDIVYRALPHARIRIVPGWVKVYGIGTPHAAPTILYPTAFASEGAF